MMNWGRWIIVAFVLFALFVGSLVYVCVSEDINLVTTNYYEEEIAYQKQIDRLENTKTLESLPELSIGQGYLKIDYSELPKISAGTIKLFRPSDSKLDQTFSLSRTEQTSLNFQLSPTEKGLYKARFTWEMNNKEYYLEKLIVL